MRRGDRFLHASLVIACLAIASACAQPPERELHEAETAVQDARRAGADRYAPEEFTGAQTALDRAHLYVKDRDYRSALDAALDARERAHAARAAAAAERERVKQQVDREIGATEVALNDVQARLEGAVRARVPAADLRAPRRALAQAEHSLAQVRAAAASGDFFDARDKARGVADGARAVARELATLEKTHGHAKKRAIRPRR